MVTADSESARTRKRYRLDSALCSGHCVAVAARTAWVEPPRAPRAAAQTRRPRARARALGSIVFKFCLAASLKPGLVTPTRDTRTRTERISYRQAADGW